VTTLVVQDRGLRWAAGLGIAGILAAVIWRVAAPVPTSATTRVAIRVACNDPRACEVAHALAVDVWSEAEGPGLPLDVVVTEPALAELTAANVAWEVLVPDIDAVAAAERARLQRASVATARPADWFAEYHDFNAITTHLHELAELAPDRVALQAIGASLEGRPLWALRIGNPSGTPMLINGTQHAREWISTMATTCVADRLVRDYATDPAIRAFVDHTNLWVVPVNPDGYQFTWSTDRYWRKNLRDRYGVDLNRNFSVAWGGAGASTNKRSETYRGAYAFSEPESQALRDLVKRERVTLHIDFHAYSQLVLYPWSYTAKPAKDRDRFAAVGDRMASAMFATHKTQYKLMSSVELYAAAGTMEDWTYGEANAFAYTIELRPKAGRGARGFVLPPEEIRPTCDEALAAVLALRAAK
jgi:carboxypeptidase T